MKKLVLAAVAAVATTAAPAMAADLMYKAPSVSVPPPAATSMFDVSFNTALVSDYILRGISQSDRRLAIQGGFEGTFAPNEFVTFYAGVWGSSLASYIANAEIDFSGGARFTYNVFGLDIGYVYYYYPGAVPILAGGAGYESFGEFYAKPTVKVTDWLEIGGSIIGGDNFNNSGTSAVYYTGHVAVTLPPPGAFDVATVISAEIGHQTFQAGIDYTTWNIGIAFTHKAATLDLRYYDTDLRRGGNTVFSPAGRNLSGSTFVAALKFDTSFSQLR